MLGHLKTNKAIEICHCVVIDVNKQAGIVTLRYCEFDGVVGGEIDKLMRVLQEVVDNNAMMILGYRFLPNTCARIDPNFRLQLFPAPDGRKRLPELFVGTRELRVLPGCLLKKRDRFFKLALLRESTSQILHKRGEVGGHFNRNLQRCLGLAEPLLLHEREPKEPQVFDTRRMQGQMLAAQGLCNIGFAGLQGLNSLADGGVRCWAGACQRVVGTFRL